MNLGFSSLYGPWICAAGVEVRLQHYWAANFKNSSNSLYSASGERCGLHDFIVADLICLLLYLVPYKWVWVQHLCLSYASKNYNMLRR